MTVDLLLSREVEAPLAAPVADSTVEAVPLRTALRRDRGRTLAVLTAINGVDYAVSAVLVAAAPDIRRDLGLSDTQLQAYASLTVVAFVLAGVPAAFAADRGRRPLLIGLMTTVAGLAAALTGAVLTGVQLAVGRVVTGAGQAAIQPVHPALLSDAYPVGARARVLGVHAAGPSVGKVIGPLVLAAAAIFAGGWRAAFVVLGVASVALGLMALRLREPEVVRPARSVAFGQAVGRLVRIRTLGVVFVGVAILGFSLVAVPIEISNHLERDLGLGTAQRSVAFALIELVGVVGLVLGSLLYERLGTQALRPLALTTIAGAVLVSGALQLSSTAGCIAALCAAQVVSGLGTTPLYTTVASVVPVHLRALGFSLMGLVIFLGGGFLGSIFAGRLSDDHGPAFAVAAIVLPTAPIAAAVLAYGTRFVAADVLAAAAVPVAPVGADALLSVRGLTVSYGAQRVLTDVDLEVRRGDVLALLGTNGAGKSTLLRAISGLLVPDAGELVLDGTDLTLAATTERVAAGIVQVPGGKATFADLTVADNLLAACHTFAWDRRLVAGRLAEVTALFPILAERLGQRAGDLSGGEQQMLALAKALVLRPRVLLIDELSLGLSPVVVSQLIEVVATLKEQGVTMVIVEQSVNVAVALADRAVFLEKGEVRWTGPTAELLERGDLARAVFLGIDRA